MTMDTVTLGHFPAPVVTAEDVATVKAAGKAAISSTKAFGKIPVSSRSFASISYRRGSVRGFSFLVVYAKVAFVFRYL